MAASEADRLRDLSALVGLGDVFANATLRMIDIKLLCLDKKRNPRDEQEAYAENSEGVQKLLQSYKAQGFLASKPLIVHDEETGWFDVLCGHLRVTAALIHGFTRVPCLVLRGLTAEQKLIYVLDHEQETLTGQIGKFKSVRACKLAGMSRMATAEKLQWYTVTSAGKRNLDMNLVQYYEEVGMMPTEIQEQWFAQQRDMLGKDVILPKLGRTEIRHLTKLKKEDDAQGFPHGDGPTFTAEIELMKNQKTTSKKKQEKAAINPTGILGMGDACSNHLFQKFLWAVSGKQGYEGTAGNYTSKIDDACNTLYPNPVAPKKTTVDEVFAPETGAIETSEGVNTIVHPNVVQEPKVEETKVEETKVEETKVEETKIPVSKKVVRKMKKS